jgi:hypothetical protein
MTRIAASGTGTVSPSRQRNARWRGLMGLQAGLPALDFGGIRGNKKPSLANTQIG